MSSRAKKKKAHLQAVPPVDNSTELAKAEADERKAANARLAWRRLQEVETAALNLRAVANFDPPDPAGPPNKHILLDAHGTDFGMLGVLRARGLTFMKALDNYEAVMRRITDHPTEKATEDDCPLLHTTVVMEPNKSKDQPTA